MPKIYRAMKNLADEKPMIDESGKGLGVRGVPVNGILDVDLDQQGNVVLNGKGMSVAPGWRDLPYFLVPRRLSGKFPGARGSSVVFCFTMGAGSFQDGLVSADLALRKDSEQHGNVVPRQLTSLKDFQTQLANTREFWQIDEE